jgi:alkylation response protein AidB-like acyl-CoA dehydrogenase
MVKLTEEQQMLLDMVKKMAKTRIAPRAEEIDEKGEFPKDIVEVYRQNGLLGLPFMEVEGQKENLLLHCLILEEIAKTCSNSAHVLAAHWLGSTPIKLGSDEGQAKKYFPLLETKLAAFSLTEAEAGSDAGSVRTKAVLNGEEYVLNGTKCFCTDGSFSDIVTIFARTDPDPKSKTRGLSAFIVERGTPGFSVGKLERQMGMRGTPACEFILEDCRVPKGNLLGKEGGGFALAMQTLDRTRPADAALAIGIAQGAIEESLNYVKERVQFGRPITDFQGIQFMFADMATQTEAARMLVYHAAQLIDEGNLSSMHSAMAKYFATDTAVSVINQAMLAMGGYGYMKDFSIERRLRDAKLMQIVEGTNQIQRLVVARHLIG